jgi:hypothetical protein
VLPAVASSPSPLRIVGNLAALVALLLGLAWLFDHLAVWLGYKAWLFCAALKPVGVVAQGVGVILCSVALITWAASRFRSEGSLALAIGAFLLGVLPMLLPHYFGASCTLP